MTISDAASVTAIAISVASFIYSWSVSKKKANNSLILLRLGRAQSALQAWRKAYKLLLECKSEEHETYQAEHTRAYEVFADVSEELEYLSESYAQKARQLIENLTSCGEAFDMKERPLPELSRRKFEEKFLRCYGALSRCLLDLEKAHTTG